MLRRKQLYSFAVIETKIPDFVKAVMAAELRPMALRLARHSGASKQRIGRSRWSIVRAHYGNHGMGVMTTFIARVHDLNPAARHALLTAGSAHAEITREDPA